MALYVYPVRDFQSQSHTSRLYYKIMISCPRMMAGRRRRRDTPMDVMSNTRAMMVSAHHPTRLYEREARQKISPPRIWSGMPHAIAEHDGIFSRRHQSPYKKNLENATSQKISSDNRLSSRSGSITAKRMMIIVHVFNLSPIRD